MTVRRGPRVAALSPALGILAGAGMIVSVFLDWYRADIGATFTASSVSGWDATAAAKALFALGVVTGLASLLVAADLRDLIAIDPVLAVALSWLVLAASLAGTCLVAVRLLWLPEPSEFLSRQIGLWAGVGASAVGALAGAGALAARA